MLHSFFDDARRNKEAIEDRTLTNRIIAEETGLTQLALLQMQNFTKERIQLSTLETLCRYFGMKSICELVDFIPQGKSKMACKTVYHESSPGMAQSQPSIGP